MNFKVQNPLDEGWYADPEARFYEGKYYIYVTHSFPRYAQQLNHTCFVSEDLTHWEKVENIIDTRPAPGGRDTGRRRSPSSREAPLPPYRLAAGHGRRCTYSPSRRHGE